MANIEDIARLLESTKVDIISELDIKLQPMRNDILYLRSEFQALAGRVNVLESMNPAHSKSTHLAQTIHTPSLLQVISDSRRKLGFSPLSLESLNSPENAVAHFLVDKMQIPPTLVKSFQMRVSEIRQTRTPGKYIVFIEFLNILDCHSIMRQVRNLPRDYNILTYIPPALMERFKKLEEIAYELRHQSQPVKTSIRYTPDDLALFSRESNSDAWIKVNRAGIPDAKLCLIQQQQAANHPPFMRPQLTLSSQPNPPLKPVPLPSSQFNYTPLPPPKPVVPQSQGYMIGRLPTQQQNMMHYQPTSHLLIQPNPQQQTQYQPISAHDQTSQHTMQYHTNPVYSTSQPANIHVPATFPYPTPSLSPATSPPTTSSPTYQQHHQLYHQMETVPAVLPNQTYQMNSDTRNQANSDGSIYSLIQRFEPSENF